MSTEPKPRIAVVDDVSMQRRVLTGMLAKTCEAIGFESGEDFLRDAAQFDLVLLDIDLAGMNGYDVCRRLRGDAATRALPVIFVSGHDTSPERVAAYEVGCDDFVIKPVVASELLHKVKRLLDFQRAQQHEAGARPNGPAANAYALGAALSILRRCMACDDATALANFLRDALIELGLQGAVQIRAVGGLIERGTSSTAAPLQSAVLASMRDMGRVFVFGSRGIINHEDVSLLVTNLPTQDSGGAAGLSDSLCVLAEGAAARLSTLATTQRANQLVTSAGSALGLLEKTLSDAMARTHDARRRGQQQTMMMLDMLGRMIEGLDLNELQRQTLQHTIEDGIESLAQINEEAALADDQFAQVIYSLRRMAAGTQNAGGAKHPIQTETSHDHR